MYELIFKKRNFTLLFLQIAFLVTVLHGVHGQNQGKGNLVINAKKIITVTGEEILNGTIIIENGIITAVGKDLEFPKIARVLNVPESVVFPGVINPNTRLGLVYPPAPRSPFPGFRMPVYYNESNKNGPYYQIIDDIYAHNRSFKLASRFGITTFALVPDDNATVGGQGAVIVPRGITQDEMALNPTFCVKFSFSPNQTKMGTVNLLRKVFVDAQKEKDRLDKLVEANEKARKEGKEEQEVKPNPRQKAMVELLNGEKVAYFRCYGASDIVMLLKLIEGYKFKTIVIASGDCYKAASLLAGKKIPVIIGTNVIRDDPDTFEKINIAREFSEAGVPVAFQSDNSILGQQNLFSIAGIAVKHGLERNTALKALTIHGAESVGLNNKIGSIEKGKDANLIILNGDPLSPETLVEKVILKGEILYETLR